jgi:hypothetical protein
MRVIYRHFMNRRGMAAGLLALMLAPPLVLQGCARTSPPPAVASAPAASASMPESYFTGMTIREIMDAQVDPAADALWDAVTFTTLPSGRQDVAPHTAEEWQDLRRKAIMLIESTNLIIMPGRQIAPASVVVAPGDLDPITAQHKLEANRAQFQGFALILRALGMQVLDAIDARDSERLFSIGSRIDEACEACHLQYWYPPQ